MAEKKEQFTQTVQVAKRKDDIRLLPFAVAGMICFTIAVILGTGSWIVFGSHNRTRIQTSAENNVPVITTETPQTTAKTEETPTSAAIAEPSPAVNIKPSIEGIVDVSGGEIALGGGDTKLPIERVVVKNFAIAETEVTNAQYADFLKETGHASPAGWNQAEFPKGTENFPVTNISYQDAVDYCKWLEKKIGFPVRLPTEAEWEMAARGSSGQKYPWGNEWNKEAAASKETGGKISAVKSFSVNRSPFGAYDMAGNVWEWTSDKVKKEEPVTDEEVKKALEAGQILRIVKGGSAQTPAAQISSQARYEIPENTRVPSVGFRYVVELK